MTPATALVRQLALVAALWAWAGCAIQLGNEPDWTTMMAGKERRERRAEMVASVPEEEGPGAGNLCIDGRLVPSLYVLGARRAATTAFAAMLLQSPDIELTEKEPNRFSSEEEFTSKGGREGILQKLPECRQDTRIVTVDCTPSYLASSWAPVGLKGFYGQQGRRLRFLVILRDPVDRMYSEFRQDVASGSTSGSFQHIVDTALQEQERNGLSKVACFESSKYADQIQAWFHSFDPKAFVFAPLRYAMTSAVGVNFNQTLFEYAWDQLAVSPPSSVQDLRAALRENSVSIMELSAESLKRLQRQLDELAGPKVLAKVLRGSGATLWGCDGCSEHQVADWLRTGWDKGGKNRKSTDPYVEPRLARA